MIWQLVISVHVSEAQSIVERGGGTSKGSQILRHHWGGCDVVIYCCISIVDNCIRMGSDFCLYVYNYRHQTRILTITMLDLPTIIIWD